MKQKDKINCFQFGNSSTIKDFLIVQLVQKMHKFVRVL